MIRRSIWRWIILDIKGRTKEKQIKTIGILLGICVAVVSLFYFFHTEKAEAEERMVEIVNYVKVQCSTYTHYNESSESKSLLRAIESARQMSTNIKMETENGGQLSEDFLKENLQTLWVDGIIVLDAEGKTDCEYSTDESLANEITEYLQKEIIMDFAGYEERSYSERFAKEDGSRIDIAACARKDAPGIVAIYYYTSPEFTRNYTLTIQRLLNGYGVQKDGTIIVADEGVVVASNDESLLGQNTADNEVIQFERSIDLSKQPKVLEIKDMCLPKKGGGWTLDHVSLDLKKGEVLGVYGLLGAGRSELFECLMGLHPEHTGDVLYEGKKLNIKDVAAQIKNGFALVPEDRQSQGLIQTLDIGKNTAISSMKDYVKGLFLDEKAENAAVDEQIKDIHIKVADKRLPILSLSGGNQQKVVIGKGLLTKPKILLLDEPSRGIDIGAKTEVFEIIHDLAEKGLSIIVISSELKEIMAIADRIVVLSNGKKTGELTGDEITEDTLVRTSYAGLGTGRNA